MQQLPCGCRRVGRRTCIEPNCLNEAVESKNDLYFCPIARERNLRRTGEPELCPVELPANTWTQIKHTGRCARHKREMEEKLQREMKRKQKEEQRRRELEKEKEMKEKEEERERMRGGNRGTGTGTGLGLIREGVVERGNGSGMDVDEFKQEEEGEEEKLRRLSMTKEERMEYAKKRYTGIEATGKVQKATEMLQDMVAKDWEEEARLGGPGMAEAAKVAGARKVSEMRLRLEMEARGIAAGSKSPMSANNPTTRNVSSNSLSVSRPKQPARPARGADAGAGFYQDPGTPRPDPLDITGTQMTGSWWGLPDMTNPIISSAVANATSTGRSVSGGSVNRARPSAGGADEDVEDGVKRRVDEAGDNLYGRD